MKRHFTATAFVVHGDSTLLHWHRKLRQWMPPGGHLMENETPAEGALREVREETGLAAEIVAHAEPFAFAYPEQAAAPRTVLIEDIDDNGDVHKHIDFIYYCRSLDGDALRPPSADDELRWVTEAQLQRNDPLPHAGGGRVAVPEDVRVLALDAIGAVRAGGG